MKKVRRNISIALFVLLLQPICLLGQTLSVYGVSLGDEKYKVENVLENKDKKINYGTTKAGIEYLKITSPNIGGVTFEGCNFYFNEVDELYRVTFYSSDAGTGTPGMPWEARFRRKAQECKNGFLTMSQNLTSKYGRPSTYSDTKAIWQKGNERITLEYEYQYENTQYGAIDSAVGVWLTYEIIDFNEVDY